MVPFATPPFFCISLALLPIYFCSYCVGCFSCKWVLETLWHFQRIFVLWKETLIMYIDFFFLKRRTFWMEARRKVYFQKINKMAYLNHVHNVDFLTSDFWFQLIHITYFPCHWNCKPNLIENEDKKGKLPFCSAHDSLY